MKYYVVDAFADELFTGNPAAVCILEKWLDDELMQSIASENNLSETAFAVKKDKLYELRWFTPEAEINLCGHATLATAFVIMNYYEKSLDLIEFESISGILKVRKKDDLYELDFPQVPSSEHPLTQDMIDAIGIRPLETYLNRDLMFILENEEQVKNASVDFTKMKALVDGKGVYLTAQGSDCDFVSRTFFPKLKVNEDPVCGSAHTSMIPYWSKKLNKKEMVAKQLSRRGGKLYCKDDGNRVRISGNVVLYSIGEICI